MKKKRIFFFFVISFFKEIETSRDAEGSITNPVEESEGGGDLHGDGDRTLGDADSSCCGEIEHRPTEVHAITVIYFLFFISTFLLFTLR